MLGIQRIPGAESEHIAEGTSVAKEWASIETCKPDTLLMYSGLKYSVCSGNAMRITLWDLLKLAEGRLEDPQSSLPPTHKEFVTAFENDHADRFRLWQIVHSRIDILAKTGPQPWGALAVWWPDNTKREPQVLMVQKKNAPWITFLAASGCPTFAMISTECLEYETTWNRWPEQDLIYGCGGNYFKKSVLRTTLAVFMDGEPAVRDSEVEQLGRSQKLVFEEDDWKFKGHLQALTVKDKRHPQLFGFVRFFDCMRWWGKVIIAFDTGSHTTLREIVENVENDEMVIEACISDLWMSG